jgi:tetratricopeptide (TPR) repeat protein
MTRREGSRTIRTLLVRALSAAALIGAVLPVPLQYRQALGDGILEEVAPDAADPEQLKLSLRKKVKADPDDAAAWRLLGRACIEEGDWDGAVQALEHALALDNQSAAIYFDYGCVAEHLGRDEIAAAAFNNAIFLAPESEYATEAADRLALLESANGIKLASYDIRSFDGSNLIPLILPRQKEDGSYWSDRVNARLDLSAQYNSNVSLAPSSREINTNREASAQGAAAFSFTYAAINTSGFRFGPSFDSDFTLNEPNVREFDLQSYRPGVFADGRWEAGDLIFKPRIAYTYDYDIFDGQTFGNKHSVAVSSGTVWAPTQVSTLYYAFDLNNLMNDGVVPNLSSQDGASNTIGIVHDSINSDWFWRSFRLGTDFQNVNTQGDNFRYYAVSAYSQTVVALSSTVNLKLRGGYAFRDYPDFQGNPSRNTNIIRAGVELRKFFDHGISVAAFGQYDHFASRNSLYDRTRYLSGVVTTWEY